MHGPCPQGAQSLIRGRRAPLMGTMENVGTQELRVIIQKTQNLKSVKLGSNSGLTLTLILSKGLISITASIPYV